MKKEPKKEFYLLEDKSSTENSNILAKVNHNGLTILDLP